MRKKIFFIGIGILFICSTNVCALLNPATQYFQIPKSADAICSVDSELIYDIFDTDYNMHFYKYSPNTKKSTYLGEVNEGGRYSGDYAVLGDRYIFSCIAIDKRSTSDKAILEREDETIRLMCIDTKKEITTEISRFNGISDLVYIEAINNDMLLVYGRFDRNNNVTKSYIDIYDTNTNKWNTPITVEKRKISAATYDNNMIYTIEEDWGEGWPFDWDEYNKPIYTLNTYNMSGKLLNRTEFDLQDLFTPEYIEDTQIYYKSFGNISVSGNYIKLDDYGSSSAIFTLKNGSTKLLYSGQRLTCWDNVGQ